jgi:hypothetical protein
MIDAVMTELIWVLGAFVIGLVGTFATLILLLGKRHVPAVLGAAGVGSTVLAAIGGGLGGLYNPDAYTGGLAAGLIHLLAAFAAVPLTGLLLFGTTVVALQHPPRHRVIPAIVVVLTLATAAATVLEGQASGNLRFGLIRGAVFAVMGLLTAASSMSASDEGGTPMAIAGLAYALFVSVVESGGRGMAASMSLAYTVGIVPHGKREESITLMMEHVAGGIGPMWIATGLGLAVGAVCVGGALRQQGPKPGLLLGLGWLILAPAALVVGMPDVDSLTAAAEAGPAVNPSSK